MSTRVSAVCFGVFLIAASATASAQNPPPADAPPPAAVTPPPAPPPPPPPAPTLPFSIRPTGHVQGVIVLSNGIQSFSFPNASAPTAAANPAILAKPDDLYLGYQVQQSRLGLWVGEGSPVRAQVEIDFIHFDTASPTVQAYPRLRIAQVEWAPKEGHRLFIGQAWDVWGPLNSHSVNLVGALFQAGNTGFLRHQLGYVGNFGPVEVAAALGLQGSNGGATFNNLERAATPIGTVRIAYKKGKSVWAGVGFQATGLKFSGKDANGASVDETRTAYGANLFVESTTGGFNLRAEGYFSQNLTNTGILGLAQGRFGKDLRDLGAWLSAKETLGNHGIYGLVGFATILNTEDVVPGYAAGTMTAAAAPSTAFGPGIEWNLSARLGYAYQIWKGMNVVAEPFFYYTRHKLDPSVTADPKRVAYGAELGATYAF